MSGQPKNVLLLVIDSLRADRLSCYGYEKDTSPFLDSVAANGLKFEQAYAPAPWTVPVHGSLFTGMLPTYHGSHRKSKSFKQPADRSLAGILSAHGFDTFGFSANPWLSPEFEFDTGFDHFEFLSTEPPFPNEPTSPESKETNLTSPSGIAEILSWLAAGHPLKRAANGFWKKFLPTSYVDGQKMNRSIRSRLASAGDSRKFVFANYMDVHDPHYQRVLESRDRLNESDTLVQNHPLSGLTRSLVRDRIGFLSEPHDPAFGRLLYDRAIRECDEYLRELFDDLSSELDMDETLTIILGDHGECMGEHGYWGHGTFLYDELLRVPLIIDPPSSSRLESLDTGAPVSLLALFEFITGLTDPSNDGGGAYEELLSNGWPLFAECTGPRPNMEGKASDSGYRAVLDAGEKYVRNCETGAVTLEMTGSSSEKSGSDTLCNLESMERRRWEEPGFQDGEDDDISPETARHLSDLGYL